VTGGPLVDRAPAKINWTLEVLGRRADGYHELRTVVQSVSLYDELAVAAADSCSLVIDGPEAGDLAADTNDNLVTRAARLFPARVGSRPPAFRLTKRIPAAAGLGGGSSDAAAALRLLRRWWALPRSVRLSAHAAALGSDVPFFLRGGAQLAAGRGERLTRLPAGPPVWLALLTPPLHLERKTARLYGLLRPEHYGDGARSAALAAKLRAGGCPGPEDYCNAFDAVADAAFPGLAEYRQALARAADRPALLSGAGPSLFAVCAGRAAAEAAAATLRHAGHRAWAVHTTTARQTGGRSPESRVQSPESGLSAGTGGLDLAKMRPPLRLTLDPGPWTLDCPRPRFDR
jgi:4-diphosphocytidyl-2-C-methyl-D-erythritol kinase